MFFVAAMTAFAGTPAKPVGAEAAQSATHLSTLPVEVELSPLTKYAPPPENSVDAPSPLPTAIVPAANAHIALLLPLKSAAFGRAAEMVRQGFMAASQIQAGKLPVTVYPSDDKTDNIVAAYQQATQAGARIVVGPLTRNGVSALAASVLVNVPTLALNLPEQGGELPPQLYVFGLAADQEARQMARAAHAAGKAQAAVLASANPLSKRIQQAFSEEWDALGGASARVLFFNGANAAELRDALGKKPEVLFLAMDGRDARLLAPFLPRDVAIYATSQVYSGNGSLLKYHDLNGVQFVDMPWLLQPDHAAVMVYPRPVAPLGADLERLYALGIDAWRLTLMLQKSKSGASFSLDGVTGLLTLDARSHQIQRDGLRAQFSDGEAALLEP